MKNLFLCFIVLFLFGCNSEVKIDPIEVAVCIDGQDYANLREYCFGPRPVDPLNPEPGDFNADICATIDFDFQCNDPVNQTLAIMKIDTPQ